MLTEEEVYNTGLAGCQIYAAGETESMSDFYLYQERGTPISVDTVDKFKRQWAYVQWTVLE